MWNSFRKEDSVLNFSFNFTKPVLSGYKKFLITKSLNKFQGAFVCVCDQNYPLVIITQPKKNGTCNPFRQEESVFISH